MFIAQNFKYLINIAILFYILTIVEGLNVKNTIKARTNTLEYIKGKNVSIQKKTFWKIKNSF